MNASIADDLVVRSVVPADYEAWTVLWDGYNAFYGRALIEAVYERAASAGSRRVYWQTHESNAVAMRLYDRIAERSGFVVYRKTL